MATLCLVLGDQLNTAISSIQAIDKTTDTILLAEVAEEATYVPHHKVKLVFVFAAMRHFAKKLKDDGYNVVYHTLEETREGAGLVDSVKNLVKQHEFQQLIVAKPAEYRLFQAMSNWQQELNLPVKIVQDNRFIVDEAFFQKWASGRKQLRMEYFYRELRKLTGILMDGNKPIGGKWNYDHDNRHPIKDKINIPEPTRIEPDETTQAVIAMVNERFETNMGATDSFHFAVTREKALQVLDIFISQRLPLFGKYQDAMLEGNPWLFHSHISMYLNAGLLGAKEVIKAALNAYESGHAPINAVEGFIRQILGWREYVRGLYWFAMPELATSNFLRAENPLPGYFWTADTKMNCVKQAVQDTIDHAYAHHIQRLMIIGNFSLLAGLKPQEVENWFLAVYADAYEWVELPNVASMALFADGGMLASKPYIASANYINKMSNYCKRCCYDNKARTGSNACPFNVFYWSFLLRHQNELGGNPRMGIVYKSLAKMDAELIDQIKTQSDTYLLNLESL